MRSVFAFFFLSLPLAGQDLATRLKTVIDGKEYAHARWGILISNSKTGETVYSRSAETMFAPASVTKLYSCAAALVALGPDYKFVTPVYAIGTVSDGTLAGDLVLVAQGDLTFGSRIGKDGKTLFTGNDHIYTEGFSATTQLTNSNPVAAFDDLAKQIKAAGITTVKGDVLIDDRLFNTSEGSGSGPRVVSPVIANDNLIDITISPGEKVGDPAKITLRPETAYLHTDFDVCTSDRKSGNLLTVRDEDLYSLRGQVALDSKPVTGIIPVRSPRDFARTLLIEALRREGVTVSAAVVRHPAASELPKASAYEELKPVAKFTSAPLSEAITVTLKVSHNLYASALPHLVAAKKGTGKTLAAGLRAQGDVLKELGLNMQSISFGGGAGGANADHVTPRATVALLQAMAKRPEWEAYKNALPVLGVDGTLASAVDKESDAKGKVFAKTGTLGWTDLMNGRNYLTSKAVAGVMTTKKGTDLTFAIFLNDMPMPQGMRSAEQGKVLGKLCEVIFENGP